MKCILLPEFDADINYNVDWYSRFTQLHDEQIQSGQKIEEAQHLSQIEPKEELVNGENWRQN